MMSEFRSNRLAVDLARSLADALDENALQELAARLRPFLVNGEQRPRESRCLLTAADAAQYAGVNVETIRRAIRAGDLSPAGRVGRSPRLTQLAVDGWLASTLAANTIAIPDQPRKRRTRSRQRPEYSLLAQFTEED